MKYVKKDAPHATSLRAIAKYNAIKRPEKVAFRYVGKDKQIVEVTFKEHSENIENMICALKKSGFEGKRFAIIGETCPEWFASYFAVVSAGAVAIPLDKDLASKEM